MNNKNGNKLKKNSNDIYFTPSPIAKLMIEMCDINENDKVLDPSYGEGVFYNNLPNCNKEYCEITMGKDFFECNDKFDLIIGNPPFSLWDKWIEHTMKLTNKFCYIMNSFNLTAPRVRKIIDNGFGITRFHLLAVEWWFGNSFICVFEKEASSIISASPTRYYCDICNKRICGRGKKGNSPNICTMIDNKI